MRKYFFVLFVIFVGKNLLAQNFDLTVKLDSSAIILFAQKEIQKRLNGVQTDQLKLKETFVRFEDALIKTETEISYSTEGGFLGIKMSITGKVKSAWTISGNNEKITAERRSVTFENSNSLMSGFDGIATSILKEKFPADFIIPSRFVEEQVENLAAEANFMELRLNNQKVKLSSVSLNESGLNIDLNLTCYVYSPDISGNNQSVVSRKWLEERFTEILKEQKKFKSKSVSLIFENDRWKIKTIAEYPFKWLWIFPDEIERTVDVNLQPAIENSDIRMKSERVDVYKNDLNEFSFINWYIRGKVETEIEKYKSIKSLIPESVEFNSTEFHGIFKIEQIDFTKFVSSNDELNFNLTGKFTVTLNSK